MGGYIWYDDNDITGYVALMKELGIRISSDDWMVSSGLAFFASGQTWNAARALYQYFISGDGSVKNISFRVSDRFSISPPNFYLFATVRGLYLETECFIHSESSSGKAVRVDIGTGLDSFGLNQTGPVDWLRFGGEYYSFQIGIPYSSLRFSPFCYLNFDRELRHKGQSVGFDLQAHLWGRFSFYSRFEHNRNDMEEQLIKNKENGVNILTALEIKL
jgi:hypothetical protein